MQRRVQIVLVMLAVCAAAVLFLYVKRSRPAPPTQVSTKAAAAPRELPPPSSAPVARSEPRAPRRAPRPATPVPPAPAPSAVPVDTATLRFTSDVPGTQVFIDRRFVGTAPVTAEHIAAGSHRVNASAEGFDGIAETIDVEPGPRDVPLRFHEVRLDAKVAVVHKHRLGSCSGQLSATPSELRYETSNADDAFHVPLADVESIDVDYLQKNLRVKLRKGKTYNFTDPAGNADHLFVFQRDVDKARQRLAHGEQPGD